MKNKATKTRQKQTNKQKNAAAKQKHFDRIKVVRSKPISPLVFFYAKKKKKKDKKLYVNSWNNSDLRSSQ